MLKANAYGSGPNQIAQFLAKIHPDYIGVAHIDEGIALRDAGVKQPILVLYTKIEDAQVLAKFNLEPVVYSMEYLKALVVLQDLNQRLNIHIEFDTGMHRLGFAPEEAGKIGNMVSASIHKAVGVMSHLSSADDVKLDGFTQKQIQLFHDSSDTLENSLGHSCVKHLCNSIGTLRFPDAHFDMVRIGIGLYGNVIDRTLRSSNNRNQSAYDQLMSE